MLQLALRIEAFFSIQKFVAQLVEALRYKP
jgi:hypothetical protein